LVFKEKVTCANRWMEMMSHQADVYYLRSANRHDGIDLLRRSTVDGIVLEPVNGWVSILAAGTLFEPNRRLIAVNRSRLIHAWCSDEHGWGFALFQADSRRALYTFDLESGVTGNISSEDVAEFADLPADSSQMSEEGIALLSPTRGRHVSPCKLSNQFLALLGVQAISGLTYESVRRQMHGSEPPFVGAAAVIDGKVVDAQERTVTQRKHEDKVAEESATFDPRLLGTWIPIREINFTGSRDIPLSTQDYTFEPNKLIITRRSPSHAVYVSKFTVRFDRNPAEFEKVPEDKEFSVAGNWGIYKIEDDTLTWCWGFSRDPRPSKCEASMDPWREIVTFRRVR
jgi:uncharacterized protein (TIGR03067 family)